MSSYQHHLEQLRTAFPPPVSDPVHDGYVVFSLLRALDQVDALKSQAPILGEPTQPDYAAAAMARLDNDGRTVEQVIPELVSSLQGMLINSHPRNQVNVSPHPSIASVIGVMLPTIFNPNLCSDESGGGVAEVELRVSAMVADLIGYDAQQAGGLFTFGGTGAMLYGVKIGLEKAMPGSLREGVSGRAVILASEQSHSACLNVAGWLGIGQDQVVRVPTHADNSIDVEALADAARQQLSAGGRIAALVATLGTTDAFGLDDLEAIHRLRDRLVEEFSLAYRPHIHADAVIGWAWSVFNDYDFQNNPLEFRGRTVHALATIRSRVRHLHLADSVGVDFHKTGFAPYTSSLVLLRDRDDFQSLVRQRGQMPYLFHSGEYHPGMYTLETTRSGTGPMAALASLRLLGREGLRVLLGHGVEMAEILREQIGSCPELTVLNHENVGPVTLFRAYPSGVDTFEVKRREQSDASFVAKLREYNEFNRDIFQHVHEEAMAGRGVAIGRTDCYRRSDAGEPLVALKSYVLSPFADETRMKSIVRHVLAARDRVQGK
jgi:glutamate/tyrosine decarboxylase-like PLP-dependent enzyme